MSSNCRKIFSGTLLISGTTIGAGMLGIPLLTARAGFLPAALITTLVWGFMVLTGFLFLEATLWMPKNAHILSMSERFLGKKGRLFAGLTFAFLYYFLLIAYFAAGAPIFSAFLSFLFGFQLTGWVQFLVFGLIFGWVVAFGIKWVNKFNYLLMAGLIFSYIALLYFGAPEVEMLRLQMTGWGNMVFAAPVLFSSFGFHNVIPSLTSYFDHNAKVMRRAIVFGTLIPLVVFLLWQWLIIGALPAEELMAAALKGEPVTLTLARLTQHPVVAGLGQAFGLFAVVTSLLGVSFSMVDFLGDGLKMERKGVDRLILCVLTFVPPFIFASLDPTIFVTAIGLAGGFGEAFLNGILPVSLVWMGRYYFKLKSECTLFDHKGLLSLLVFLSLVVVVLEVIVLHRF